MSKATSPQKLMEEKAVEVSILIAETSFKKILDFQPWLKIHRWLRK